MKSLPPIYIKLGNLIRTTRMAKNLSLEELAWRCMLHPNAIWKVEKAQSEIRFSTMLKLFKELEIDFSQIQTMLDSIP